MRLLQCFLTLNACHKAGKRFKPKGVMIHSTGANNPNVKRYVQPAADDPAGAELLKQIGVNRNGNDWNNTKREVCVHAFIGKLADGTIGTVQTLPWNIRAWHSGRGVKGSANDTHIGFEICEDGLADRTYFNAVYQEAVELTAMLCKENKWNPLADGVVICHSEGYKRGIASNHGDVMHWFPKHGKSMDTFRRDVNKAMMKEDDEVTQEQFDKMMDNYLERKATENPSAWSAEARAYCEKQGIIKGDAKGKKRYKAFCTREELAQMLYNMK